MKKIFLLFLLFITSFNLYPQGKDFARWSITAEYGYNLFDGDINQNLISIFPSSLRDITYGGTIEYAFTPIAGISLDYFYFPLKAQNTTPALLDIDTKLHNADLNATFNFTRWIFPQTKSRFYFNGSIGIGFASYTINPISPTTGIAPTNILLNDAGLPKWQSASVPVTFSGEYNFSKPFAIGAKIHYRAYNKDNLEGVSALNWKGVTNDYIAAGTLYLRYKFGSIKRDHLRNIRVQDYEPDAGLILAQQAMKEIAGLKPRLDNADKKIADLGTQVGDLGKKVDGLIPRIENIEKIMASDGPDADNDGVPDARDMDPNTPPNTPVDFWGKPNVRVSPEPNVNTITKTSMQSFEDIPTVYFDFDRIDLDEDAIETISKIALKMRSDSTLLVEVRGYCDYLGDVPYNEKLSLRRAVRVKQELVKMWAVSEKRIIVNGKGKLIKPAMKYRPNRRCEFYFDK